MPATKLRSRVLPAVLIAVFHLAASGWTYAQSNSGQYYYAIEDLSDGSIVRRGSFQLSDRRAAETLLGGDVDVTKDSLQR